MGKRILVIAAGDRSPADGAPSEDFDLVIAADGGLDWARSLGIPVDVVVGDLDSTSLDALTQAREAGVELDTHPAEKDHTDLQLALERAIRETPDQIQVIGASGGRPDHWLTNVGLLGATAQAGPSVTAELNGWTLTVVLPGKPYSAEAVAGELVSLVPVGGDASGVTTDGLAYPLDGDELAWGGSRGVSNVARGGAVRVHVEAGILLVLRPTSTPS